MMRIMFYKNRMTISQKSYTKFFTTLDREAHKKLKMAAAYKGINLRAWLETYATPIAEDHLLEQVEAWKKANRRAKDER